MSEKKNDLLFLLVVTLFWFSQYVFVPFLSPHLAALGTAASAAGVILGAYGFSQLVLRIPVSVGEDCVGHDRLFMIAGLLALVIGNMLPVFSDAPAVYLVSRTLAGVSASTWVSFTVSFTRGHEQVKPRMGRLIAANNLGVLMSYILGGVLYQWLGMKPLFVLSSLIGLTALLVLPLCKINSLEQKRTFRLRSVVEVILNRHLLLCSFMGALVQLIGFATSMSFVNNYAQLNGISGFGLSLVAIAFYVAGVAGSTAFSKGLFSRMRERTFMALGFAVLAAYCAMLPLCTSLAAIILAQLVGGVGRTLLYTHLMAVSPAKVSAEQKTTAMGVFQSIYSLGMTMGPVVMGWLLDSTGANYTIAFLCVAAFAVAGAVWSLVSWPRERG